MLEPVLDTDDLLRRVIFTNPSYVRPDQTVTSFAFRPRQNETGLSVDIFRLTTYQKSIKDRFNYRLYSLKAINVRKIGLDCIHNPIEGNYAHALIIGNITNGVSKKLSISAHRVSYPA